MAESKEKGTTRCAERVVFTGDVTDWFKVSGSLKRASVLLQRSGSVTTLALRVTPVKDEPSTYLVEWTVKQAPAGSTTRDALLADRADRKKRQAAQDEAAAARAARQAAERAEPKSKAELAAERDAILREESRARAAGASEDRQP